MAHPESEFMAEESVPRRSGRPPAGARAGEKVKDYPQLSIRVPAEMKARLNALSAVTGLAQWRLIVEAIDCFFEDLPDKDRELVTGLSQRLLKQGSPHFSRNRARRPLRRSAFRPTPNVSTIVRRLEV